MIHEIAWEWGDSWEDVQTGATSLAAYDHSYIDAGVYQVRVTVAGLNFHSSSYEWLVIAGPKAMYKGTGTINGTGDYDFMITAIDEKLTSSTDVDLFRIKILDKENNTLIYDNQLGEPDDVEPATAVFQGNIVVHKAK